MPQAPETSSVRQVMEATLPALRSLSNPGTDANPAAPDLAEPSPPAPERLLFRWGVLAAGVALLLGMPLVLITSPWPHPLAVAWLAGTAGFLVGAGGLLGALLGERKRARFEAERRRVVIERLEAANASLREARSEAERAAEASTLFLASMSHEIRTPLNGMLGMSEVLAATKLDEQQQRYLGSMQSGADMLAGIVEEVLDYTRILGGRTELVLRSLDLRDLVDDVVELHAPLAERKDLVLAAVIDKRLDGPVRADQVRLKQVIGNLVGNAVKYTDAGTVKVSAEQVHESGDRVTVRFEVHDTGPGIPPSERDVLFEPFRRSAEFAGREVPGVGLGLSVAKQLVEAMGGRIGVESAVGEGSAFWVEVPFERSGATARVGLVASSGIRNAQVTVLGAPALLEEALTAQLTAFGCTVRRVGSGRSLTSEPDSNPDVVLLVTSGEDERWRRDLEIVREELPPGTPIVLLTPCLHPIDPVEASRASASRTLRSPYRARLLLGCLEEALGLSESTERMPAIQFPGPAPLGSVPRVLIVDDNALNREVLETWCGQFGLHWDSAADGEEAVELAQQHRYAVILMDCHMPGLDGVGATGRIRGGRGPSAHAPIVAVTADARVEFLSWCQEAGMNDSLPKPIRRDSVGSMLEKWIPGWTASVGPLPPVVPRRPPPRAAADVEQTLPRRGGKSVAAPARASQLSPSPAPAPYPEAPAEAGAASTAGAPAEATPSAAEQATVRDDSVAEDTVQGTVRGPFELETNPPAPVASIATAPIDQSLAGDEQRKRRRKKQVSGTGTRAFLSTPEMLAEFERSNAETLEKLRVAMDASSFEEAASAAHFLKSNCALAEAEDAWTDCQDLEDALRAQRLDDARGFFASLESALDAVTEELRAG